MNKAGRTSHAEMSEIASNGQHYRNINGTDNDDGTVVRFLKYW